MRARYGSALPTRLIEPFLNRLPRCQSPSTRRRCSSRISSAMVVGDSRTSSANGAFGRQDRQESAGMRLVTAALWCRSRVRKSIAFMVWHAGQRTHRNQYRAVIAAPIVGANSIGIRLAWRSFQAAIRRSASSSTWASVARRLAASFSAARRRSSSILRRLTPMAGWSISAPACQAELRVSRFVFLE